MKRLLAVVVCIMMAIGSFAFGENEIFTFRNGIRFGDTMDEVQEKEESRFFAGQFDDYVGYYGLTMSDISNSILNYYFDHEGHMNRIYVKYTVSNNLSIELDDRTADYIIIENGLTAKYGEPVPKETISDLVCHPNGAFFEFLNKQDFIIYADQRIIPYDDAYNIFIEHLLYKKEKQYKKRDSYGHILTYQIVDKNAEQQDPILKDL